MTEKLTTARKESDKKSHKAQNTLNKMNSETHPKTNYPQIVTN